MILTEEHGGSLVRVSGVSPSGHTTELWQGEVNVSRYTHNMETFTIDLQPTSDDFQDYRFDFMVTRGSGQGWYQLYAVQLFGEEPSNGLLSYCS
jgi:hypothetical protein